MPYTVASILSRKTKHIISAAPDTTVLEALRIMSDNNIGSLIVMDGNKYLGVISERDYARKVVLQGKLSSDIPVSEIMNTETPTVTSKHTIDECMDIVDHTQARYLPVIDNNDVSGIVSIIDLIKATSQMHKESAQQLRDYISST
ncbi:MAG: CBS domain-containing protein [Chitinophagaceae bacterium]|nr:CBS domain-containing protein [Chitinophagaceae bacterium]